MLHCCYSLSTGTRFRHDQFFRSAHFQINCYSDQIRYERLWTVPEEAMKFVGLSISIILLIASAAAGQSMQSMPVPYPAETPTSPTSFPTKPEALTICAGNVPPEDMVITATGTSYTCSGSCRSRQVEPAKGPIMVICAGQSIPQYYETESVTTSPACNCIADQDNAYVIRRINTAPTASPSPPGEIPQGNAPYGSNNR